MANPLCCVIVFVRGVFPPFLEKSFATMIFGLTVAEFEDISLKLLLTGLIAYMMFIIWNLARESKAGRYGTAWMFFGLGFGVFGFMAKSVIAKVLGIQ